MNYKAIVYLGFNEPSSRKNIKNYFIRHYENAKEKNYTLDDFFNYCLEAVKEFEGYLDEGYLERKKSLLRSIEIFKLNDGKDDLVKQFQDELKNLKKENLPRRFSLMVDDDENHKIEGWIKYSDLEHWKTTLEDVKLSLQPKKIKKPSNIEPLNFELNQAEVIYLFDILQVAGFIHPPAYHNGSYYRKLETCFSAEKKPIKDAEQKRNKFKQGVPLSTAENIQAKLIEAIKKMPY